jgi:hypothetical protein
VSNLHKNTSKSFTETAEILHKYIEPRTGKPGPLVSDRVYDVIQVGAITSRSLASDNQHLPCLCYQTLSQSLFLPYPTIPGERGPTQQCDRVRP